MKNCKGFTIIEILVSLVIVSSLIALTVSVFDKVGFLDSEPSEKIYSDLTSMQTALMKYDIDKGNIPTSFATIEFVPQYLMIPKIHDIFNRDYGESGYNLDIRTGQSSPNNGIYICFNAEIDSSNKKIINETFSNLEDKIQTDKFFYNTVCPSVNNVGSFPESGNIYGTFWITRN